MLAATRREQRCFLPMMKPSGMQGILLLISILILISAHTSTAFVPFLQQSNRNSSTSLGFFGRFRRNNSQRHVDDHFDYTTISTELPPHLTSIPAIQELEDVFDDDTNNYVCQHGWMDSVEKDGARLHYRRFLPKEETAELRGIIVWMHGIQGFGGGAHIVDHGNTTVTKTNMAFIADRFVGEKNYTVYSLDLYGHGYSEGRRHFVTSWQNNLQDYTNFLKHVASLHDNDDDDSVPLFCAGESYGGCLTLHLAAQQEENEALPPQLDSILLLAPAVIAADLPPAPVTFILKQILARLAPRWQPFFMPHPVSPENVWRDETLRQRNLDRTPEPYIGGSGTQFRLGTAVQLLDALDACRDTAIPALKTTPFCVVHGDNDRAVPIDGTNYLDEHAPVKERAVRREPGAYHDLLADPAKDNVVKFLLEWTEGRIAKRAAKVSSN
ncbi:Monoglyceride lipase [Seminavis robusta]|uniref:Monoglyceride lipase n=1 Tax=Seminavis robusta TaxID=568900 RepID=A0A9N8ECW0_9STRA|nr:Monoglyceride lipase [Seminavis robusta]|eukprot:Sro964_g225380.1 Monoglyceride lipase (440) ;mRNA; r:1799-3118